MIVARRFIAGSGTTWGLRPGGTARIPPRDQSQISHRPSANTGFKLCRTETEKEAEPQALKVSNPP